jgi:DNA end-binding protein Ku
MAPRPAWKGYLKLSLVSCAVAMYTATSTSSRIRLNIINRETGNRIRNQAIDSETGDVVEPEDKVKGYEIDKGQYVLLEEEELDEVALESTHTIDIESFVPREEVDEIYLDESFYIVPDDEVAYEAFAVIREAMKKKDMVALGRVVMHRRERLLMLQPRSSGMMATTLRYPYEVRQDGEYFAGIPEIELPPEMLDIAQEIIARKSGHFEPDKFTDRYEEAVVEMMRAKQAGQTFAIPEAAAPANVVNIMDALKRSLQAEGADAASIRRPRAPSKKPAEAPAATRKPKARKAAR